MIEITWKVAAVTSIIVESILYGFSTFMFGITIWALFYKRTAQQLSRLMFTVTCSLFTLSTLHMIASSMRVYRGFITFDGSPAFFADQREYTFQDIVYSLETLLGDGILIYRCYIVWNSVGIIVIPSMLWIAVAVTTSFTVRSVMQSTANSDSVFRLEAGRWILSFYSTTFATNLMATSLLAYKIWRVNRASRTHALHSNLYPVLLVIMECGALYSASLITLISTYATMSRGTAVVITMIAQIIPITFYLIIIRAAMARLTEDQGRSALVFHSSSTDQSTQPGYAMDIRIGQIVDKDLGT